MRFLIGLLDGWRALTEALERTLVDNVAATVPWLAPMAPAYMAFHNVTGVFGWPEWIAWMIAGAVEGLGLAVVSTAFQLWDWNDRRNTRDDAAPVWLAIGATGFYLLVVITVNVLLDEATIVERAAKALLSMLSIVAAVTLALRAQHARRLEAKRMEKEIRREERKEARLLKQELKLAEAQGKLPKVSGKVSEIPDALPVTFGKWETWRRVPREEQLKIVRMNAGQVVETYGVSERTAYNWLEYARRDHGVVGEVAQFQEELDGVISNQ